ncbi:carboxymuconolactone decarboxylase family protein [Sphingomonas sp. NBWT7]|uniref:carboxymuconolactone decarboxylase family protein n=1 Tax=Sphingomonas sp. NBWT7 TaxID=2596913 RepID=UPI001623E91B|nr:carboxymuconolactone decarboxylase family protein [Sphingomonas sp. NBWT7]QNE31073.1 carboxymuconolactone decarboxylase family protein [Sphingomonas sp. NBWT7]
MTPRIDNPSALFPAGIKAMMTLEQALHAAGLDSVLLELVKLRASQINGCAFCIHMHATFLRRHEVAEMKLYMLDAWRESTLYSARERAALGWTEALTLLAETKAPDRDYEALREQFSDEEQVQLTLAIGAINTWNRLQVGFRAAHPPEPEEHHAVD